MSAKALHRLYEPHGRYHLPQEHGRNSGSATTTKGSKSSTILRKRPAQRHGDWREIARSPRPFWREGLREPTERGQRGRLGRPHGPHAIFGQISHEKDLSVRVRARLGFRFPIDSITEPYVLRTRAIWFVIIDGRCGRGSMSISGRKPIALRLAMTSQEASLQHSGLRDVQWWPQPPVVLGCHIG